MVCFTFGNNEYLAFGLTKWQPPLVLFTSPSGLSTSGDKSNSGSSGVNAAVVGGIIAAVAVVAIAIGSDFPSHDAIVAVRGFDYFLLQLLSWYYAREV